MTKVVTILYKELDSLVKGTSTNERGRTVSKLAAQIVYDRRLDIEDRRLKLQIKQRISYAKHSNDTKTSKNSRRLTR